MSVVVLPLTVPESVVELESATEGLNEGRLDGDPLMVIEGLAVGKFDGISLGGLDGSGVVGAFEGDEEGDEVGLLVGVGSD